MKLIFRSFFLCAILGMLGSNSYAAPVTKPVARVMALDFQLNDLTDLPNAPEELARVSLLSATFKQKLIDRGIELVAVNELQKAELASYPATYLFDHPDIAAKLADDSGADYVIIAVALKPTYLFVYPRILLVDVKTRKVAFPTYAQLESSWQDENTTVRTAETLATKVGDKVIELMKK